MVADGMLAIVLLYLSFWIYETANFVVLSLWGVQASISMNGIFPAGTASLSNTSTWNPSAKVVQTALCGLATISVAYASKRSRFLITEISAICVLSVFLSSFYWEALTLIPRISYPIHISVFVGLTAAIEFALFTVMNRKSSVGFSGDTPLL